jgi:hypothetical protein
MVKPSKNMSIFASQSSQDEQEKEKKSLKQIAKNVFEDSTIHGISNMVTRLSFCVIEMIKNLV